MKAIVLWPVLSMAALAAFAQTDTSGSSNDTSHVIIEVQPMFPGGVKAMYRYISKNISYPKEARNENIQGRVVVRFVIEKDGSITRVKIMESVHPTLDEEAMRVVKGMPNWSPGTQRGKPVRVFMQLPIDFMLGNGRVKDRKSKKNKKRK